MKVSASIELVWQMAGQEAIASEHKEIEPEHFFAALLKLAELPTEEVEKLAAGSEAVKELSVDITAVHQELESRAVDTTRVRRELRAKLGKGGCSYDGGQKHRSVSTRDFFDAAAKLADDAGSRALTPSHILLAIFAAPTPAMVEVMRNAVPAITPKPAKTPPLLAEFGRDLKQLAAAGKLSSWKNCSTEARALFLVIAQTPRPCVLLLGDDDDAACNTIAAVAYVMLAKDCPAALRSARIVDVTPIVSAGTANADNAARLGKLLDEATGEKDLILFLPAINSKTRSCLEVLKAALTRGGLKCVVRVSPLIYETAIEKDSGWKRLAQPMWIHPPTADAIPDEL